MMWGCCDRIIATGVGWGVSIIVLSGRVYKDMWFLTEVLCNLHSTQTKATNGYAKR